MDGPAHGGDSLRHAHDGGHDAVVHQRHVRERQVERGERLVQLADEGRHIPLVDVTPQVP